MDVQVAQLLQTLRRELETVYGERLVSMLLYGSHARGEAAAGSDVDVAVILHGPVQPAEEISRMGGALASLALEYGVLVSCVFLSAERYEREQSPLLLNLRREGIAA
jgi:predicted nucleotidyltransferase